MIFNRKVLASILYIQVAMFKYFFLALAVLLISTVWTFFKLRLLLRTKAAGCTKPEICQSAEIDGGVWERKSVLEHIEQGLKRNARGPALICLFQPPNHIADLVSERPPVKIRATGNGLWQNHDFTQTNGIINKNNRDLVFLGDRDETDCSYSASIRSHTTEQIRYLTLSYEQLHDTSMGLAAGLIVNGASANTIMVLLIPNGSEFALLLYTCVLLRITYVFLDPALLNISGFTVLKHQMKSLKPQIVVAPDPATGKALEVAMAELQLAPAICVSLTNKDCGDHWKSLKNIASTGKAAIAKGIVDDAALAELARRDKASRIHSVMFTSGTSGLPKGCPLRVGGMSHALESQSWLLRGGRDEDGPGSSGAGVRALMQAHNSRGIAPAQTLQTWRAGGAVVLTGQAFDVEQAVDAIARVRVTFLVLTPAMVHGMAAALAARPAIDVGCVRAVQVGGDTVTRGLLERCEALFPNARVCVNHGMTEGPGAFMWPRRFSRMPVSQLPFYGGLVSPVGCVAPGARVRVCENDKEGRAKVIARGELGELHVSCPSIIKHYWNGRSDESFYDDTDGKRWFKTGDISMVDKDGIVFVLGRTKDSIRCGGILIMPAPIENLVESITAAQVHTTPFHPSRFEFYHKFYAPTFYT